MKVITALGNQHLQNSLKNSYHDLEFTLEDISYQEGVLEAIKSHAADALIINIGISGNYDINSYIDALCEATEDIKIVVILNTINKPLAKYLSGKGINDVFIDGSCTFEDIYESLKREQKVIIRKEIQKEYIEKERIITQEKLIRELVQINFKKLILSIWGKSEFACELSYTIAKLTSYQILLLELDNYFPKTDIYLGLWQKSKVTPDQLGPPLNYADIFTLAQNTVLNMQTFDKYCLKRKDAPNLSILMPNTQIEYSNISQVNMQQDKQISYLIDQAYNVFDIVIISLSPSPCDTFSNIATIRSDYVIAAFPATADYMKDLEQYLLYMKVKNNFPLDKLRYVAYEYKKDLHYSLHQIKDIFPRDVYLGMLPYRPQREQYRNMKNCFARWLVKKHPSEYEEILLTLNILPRKPLLKYISEKFTKYNIGLSRKFKTLMRILNKSPSLITKIKVHKQSQKTKEDQTHEQTNNT